MTSYLIDTNVWLALSWRLHPNSGQAHVWMQELPKDRTKLVFCRITQLGLLRLLTNEMVMGDSALTVAEAIAIFDRWCEDPRVEFMGEPVGVERAFRHAAAEAAKKSATKVVMDAYLVGFAETEGMTLVTFDKGLSKIAARNKISYRLLTAH